MQFEKVDYRSLNARQKEIYNLQRLEGKLALYGLHCLKLTDDWNGADLIAQKFGGTEFLRIQLKSRFTVAQKYEGRGLWIAFPLDDRWFLYPHDELLTQLKGSKMLASRSWLEGGAYSNAGLPREVAHFLVPFELT